MITAASGTMLLSLSVLGCHSDEVQGVVPARTTGHLRQYSQNSCGLACREIYRVCLLYHQVRCLHRSGSRDRQGELSLLRIGLNSTVRDLRTLQQPPP